MFSKSNVVLLFRLIHSDINLLREPASGLRGARHPRVLHVHSGACAPGFPNASPLATISVAMYRMVGGQPIHLEVTRIN